MGGKAMSYLLGNAPLDLTSLAAGGSPQYNSATKQFEVVPKYGGAYFYTAAAGAPTAIVIDTANLYHGIYLTSLSINASGWTHKAGARAVVDSVADNGTGTILCTTNAAHGFAPGDYICHTGFAVRTTYRGKYKVLTTPLTTTYTVARAFETATDAGFATRAFSLRANTGSAGMYLLTFSCSMQCDSATTDIRIEANLNATDLDNIASQNLFGTQNRPGCLFSSGIITVADDDVVYCSIKNLTDAADVKVWLANLYVARL